MIVSSRCLSNPLTHFPQALFSDSYRALIAKEGATGDLSLNIIKK